MPVGLDNLNIISDEAFEQVQELRKNNSKIFIGKGGNPQTGVSELMFEAYMRWMDAQVRKHIQ